MVKIAIVTGSTRSARVNPQVAQWLQEFGEKHFSDHQFDILDIDQYDLPLFAGDVPPAALGGEYEDPKVQRWADDVKEYDGYIFVTPEYNRNITPELANALDHLSGEFHNKSAGIASYGGTLGTMAVVMLRTMLANFRLAVVATPATFSINTDFVDMQEFQPADYHAGTVSSMMGDVIAWAEALKPLHS